jgi:ribonuclease P protein component
MKRYGFPKSVRMLRSADFRKVYAGGKRRNMDWLTAFSLETGNECSRIGLTVPAAFGPAVERNRIKRRMREAVRRHWAVLGPGWDIVLNPRRTGLACEFPQIEASIQRLFQSCSKARGDSGVMTRP